MTIDLQALVARARAVRDKAHAPYSKYRVGAAVLDDLGEVHVGCNVENTALPQGSCAEANAIGAMVSAGGSRIVGIAVVGGRDALEPCTPCGGCRQRILEFADEATEIVTRDEQGALAVRSIDELLPASIRPL